VNGPNRAYRLTVTTGHGIAAGHHRLAILHGNRPGRTDLNAESAANT
jgi:hypothetical protein